MAKSVVLGIQTFIKIYVRDQRSRNRLYSPCAFFPVFLKGMLRGHRATMRKTRHKGDNKRVKEALQGKVGLLGQPNPRGFYTKDGGSNPRPRAVCYHKTDRVEEPRDKWILVV